MKAKGINRGFVDNHEETIREAKENEARMYRSASKLDDYERARG